MSRCCFSQELFRELAKHFDDANMASISGSKRQMTYFLSYLSRAAEFWSTTPGLTSNVFQVHLGSVLFEQMIMRCMDLCNRKLRSDWRSFPHQFLLLLEGELQLLSSMNVAGFEAPGGSATGFRSGRRGQVLPHAEGAALGVDFNHDRVIRIKAPDASLLLGDSPTLKKQLSVALNVKLEPLTKLLAEHNYILTFDFLMKMLHIRERRLALVPTIIEGETGVGKTKLLNVYAAIETMGFLASYQPLATVVEFLGDVLETCRDQLKAFSRKKIKQELLTHGVTIQRLFRFCVQTFVELQTHDPDKLPFFFQLMRGLFEGVHFNHPLFNVHQCAFYVKTVLSDPKTLRRVDLQGDAASSGYTTEAYQRFHTMPMDKAMSMLRDMWGATIDPKSPTFSSAFQASPSEVADGLKAFGDEILKKIDKELRPAPPKKEGDVVDDAEKPFELTAVQAFARWCMAWLLTDAVPTFHTILMHAAYTVEDLKRELGPVVRFANRARECFASSGRETAKKIATAYKTTPGGCCFPCACFRSCNEAVFGRDYRVPQLFSIST